ncbi:MAG: hypothetical protein QOG21_326 [Actinomycetota bacterium]|nr:hypothetical protein [Actinomycetota bacterium]
MIPFLPLVSLAIVCRDRLSGSARSRYLSSYEYDWVSCYQEGAFECRSLWASARQCARRLEVCGDGSSVRKFDGAASVVNLDSSEVAQEKLLSVFGAKRALESRAANQLTQFVEMIASVRYRD